MWWRQRWRNPVETSRMRRGHTFFFFDEWGHTFLSRTFVQTPHTQSEKWGVFVLCFVFADQKIKKNVWSSVLLQPSNPEPKFWSWPCWTARWPQHLCFWLTQLQACYPSHLWCIWYPPTHFFHTSLLWLIFVFYSFFTSNFDLGVGFLALWIHLGDWWRKWVFFFFWIYIWMLRKFH